MFANENKNISNLITGKDVSHVRDREDNKAADPKGMVKEAGNAPGTGTKDPVEAEPMLSEHIIRKAKAFTQAGTPPDMAIVRANPHWTQDKTADAKGPESSI